jgi:hypothetical protein
MQKFTTFWREIMFPLSSGMLIAQFTHSFTPKKDKTKYIPPEHQYNSPQSSIVLLWAK